MFSGNVNSLCPWPGCETGRPLNTASNQGHFSFGRERPRDKNQMRAANGCRPGPCRLFGTKNTDGKVGAGHTSGPKECALMNDQSTLSCRFISQNRSVVLSSAGCRERTKDSKGLERPDHKPLMRNPRDGRVAVLPKRDTASTLFPIPAVLSGRSYLGPKTRTQGLLPGSSCASQGHLNGVGVTFPRSIRSFYGPLPASSFCMVTCSTVAYLEHQGLHWTIYRDRGLKP